MCGKFLRTSGTLSRALLASFFLLLLVASPLAAWPIRQAETKAEPVIESTPSTPVGSETKSTEVKISTSPTLPTPQIESETSSPTSPDPVYTMTEAQLLELTNEITRIREATLAAVQTEQIEDALDTAIVAEETALVEEYNALAATVAERETRIAELEKEAGSKAFLTLGGVMGFDNHTPTIGVSMNIGTKIGKSLLLQAGAEYDLGKITAPLEGLYNPSLENIRITAAIGWLF